MSVQADSRNDRRGWLRELVASATNPLLLALLLVSLLPLALMGYATYRSASQALDVEARGKLTVVREITVKQVERYFGGLHDQLRVLADDPSTREALTDFRDGFRTVLQDGAVAEPDELPGLLECASQACVVDFHRVVARELQFGEDDQDRQRRERHDGHRGAGEEEGDRTSVV
jgi:hypothetical protein